MIGMELHIHNWMYTNLYTDINGCDSTVTLDLTINNSSYLYSFITHVILMIGME